MAEKKDIAQLDFNINDAINSLEKVDKKLKSISDSSEAYAKKIGKNLGNAINSGNLVDSASVNKALNNVNNLSKTKADQLSVQLTKIKAKEQADINKIVQKGEQDRQTAAYKTALKQEQYNERVSKSTKTLYDKISDYAKTYVIYQGFNELRKMVTETIDEMVELEYQMVQIDRVLNESSLNIDTYRDKLIQMAYDYGNSFNNVADITLRLAQAGFNSQESLMMTEKTLLALNTAELDATQATEDMVAVMAQWGLMTGTASEQAESYGNIIDKINKVADNFPTTSEDILNALKKTSSAFNLAGASIDETIATIVAAEKASQRGGKVIGTALSNITQQLKADGKLNLAEDLGLNFFVDADKTQFKPIMEIFEEMATLMEQLKNEGKENSVEMQNLLEMFTVFRRNVGASLLGEMAGEDSTYAEVLRTSLDSVGYSLQENSKHMQTAKAAQAQFNAELLKLKTQVWDEGLESVFRDMLNLGTELVAGIGGLIDKFGVLPTTIGAATLAYSSLSKSMRTVTYDAETNSIKFSGFLKTIVDGTESVRKANSAFRVLKDGQVALSAVQGTSIKAFGKNVLEVGKYTTSLVLATAKTVALQVATVALNAALSMGISLAITVIVSAINDWINAEEKAIEKNKELMEISKENANTIKEEVSVIQELRKEYEELAQKSNRTSEEDARIYEIQEELNSLIKDSGFQVELINKNINEQGEAVAKVNDKYDEQISKLKAIEYQKKQERLEELKNAMDIANALQKPLDSGKVSGGIFEGPSMANAFVKAGISEEKKTIFGTVNDISINPQMYEFNQASMEEQINMLEEWSIALRKVNDGDTDVAKSLSKVEEALKNLKDRQSEVTKSTQEYTDALAEIYDSLGFVDVLNVALQSIADSYDIEGPKKLIEDIQNINTEFSNGKINIEEYFNKIEEKIKQIDLSSEGEELEAYQAIFAETTKSLAEGLEGLVSGLETGSINFVDYSQGVKEAADNMLALRVEQNNLEFKDGVWQDATGSVDEYANSLQNAINELQGMGELLTVIGDNYDYIAEHANAAGEAIFSQTEVGTQAYTNLANSVASSLSRMRNDNAVAYKAITDDIFAAMGASANEVANADAYITEALNGNAQALNAALNASAAQVATSTNKVTASMGRVLSELGNAISNFKYNITATPFISGKMGIRKDENGLPTGIDLPSFGFDVSGSGGGSIQNLGTALSAFGADLMDYGSSKFTYTQLKSRQQPYKSTGGNVGGSGGSTGNKGSGGGSGGGSSSRTSSTRDTSAEDAKKAAEEEYKARLSAFTDYIKEQERLEKRWVDKQKELGQLSNKDFLYIIQQRIERYKKYLDEVKKATWMNQEDRLELEKEYSEEIEDLQVDYLGYLQDQLDEEIQALEDANEEKIKLIEEEADARIAALKKVSDSTNRNREEETYQKERQSILDEISYWEQRTGREAQEALIEARKKLEKLDEEWKEQLEDWSIEDQIQAIEDERDAQVKAIQDAQAAEIASMQEVYDAKVKMFAETGQIIYEGSVIQSQKLYSAYKQNFIDPISSDLAKLNQPAPAPAPSTTTTTAPKKTQQYETYTIKYGDTLTRIANNFGTTIEKIMAANPYVTNKNRIYAGKTLQIPKFHNGGIVGGNQEAFALLKPNEVILKPEWADGINKLAQLVKKDSGSITNSTVVEVKGDMVKIEANIKDKTDAEYLTRRIEKMLKDKFNVKK